MKIDPEKFHCILRNEGVEFYTGVPDSTIKSFCFYLENNLPKSNHVIASNEGNSIAIATGYHLSTGKIPLVYMQNSGLGNAINPLTSLVDKELFAIPMLIMMGWRGEPGKKDAIQHLGYIFTFLALSIRDVLWLRMILALAQLILGSYQFMAMRYDIVFWNPFLKVGK